MMAHIEDCLTHEEYTKQFDDFRSNYTAATGFSLSTEVMRLSKILNFVNFDSLRDLLMEENKYENTGRPSKDPCCMMRALLVASKQKIKSPEDLAEKLEDPCFAAVCGFIPKPNCQKESFSASSIQLVQGLFLALKRFVTFVLFAFGTSSVGIWQRAMFAKPILGRNVLKRMVTRLHPLRLIRANRELRTSVPRHLMLPRRASEPF